MVKKLNLSDKVIKGSERLPSSRLKLAKEHTDSIDQLEKQIKNLKTREATLNKRTASLEKRNLRLEELNEIKDEFIGIASHQLRTPATGVKQYINLLLDGFAEDLTPNQRIFLERAHESNDRQLRIIDDLLRVAKIDSESFTLRLSLCDIGKLVDDTINDLRGKLKQQRQRIEYSQPKRSIVIQVDAERLRMVIENIIDNAINYSKQNRTIKIKVTNTSDFVKVIIKDEGVGIEKKDFPKLFQKFSRIPNPLSVEVGGSGLGLYWAHKVITLHKGKIDVQSSINRGSTFTVNIPKL